MRGRAQYEVAVLIAFQMNFDEKMLIREKGL